MQNIQTFLALVLERPASELEPYDRRVSGILKGSLLHMRPIAVVGSVLARKKKRSNLLHQRTYALTFS